MEFQDRKPKSNEYDNSLRKSSVLIWLKFLPDLDAASLFPICNTGLEVCVAKVSQFVENKK